MQRPRLTPALLAPLLRPKDGIAEWPRYEHRALKTGIVHLGLGAFARAHLAAATEAAIEASGDLGWGICGVSLRHADVPEALAPQGGLYALALRDADAEGTARQRVRVIGCVAEVLAAPADPAAVLDRIAAAGTRIVSITVTEKGYCRANGGNDLDLGHPDVARDLRDARRPGSVLGYVVRGLALRRLRGVGGVTLLSLDNLSSNGRTLRRLVFALASHVDPELAAWIDHHCSFPCSMVDRIVPRTVEADRDAVSLSIGAHDAWPVVAEPFFDWAVEDRFVRGRPAWDHAGARFIDDAAPWEQMKLRLVNGAHSAIAYLGMLAGWETVDAAMADSAMRRFVAELLREELAPTLPALQGFAAGAACAALLERFANPALAHATQQIAMDGSQKIPLRWLPALRARQAAGQPCRRLALALAAWIASLGTARRIDDPMAEALAAHAAVAMRGGDSTAEARAWFAFAPVFGTFAAGDALVRDVATALHRLRALGARTTLQDF